MRKYYEVTAPLVENTEGLLVGVNEGAEEEGMPMDTNNDCGTCCGTS